MKNRKLKIVGFGIASLAVTMLTVSSLEISPKEMIANSYFEYRKAGGTSSYYEWLEAGSPKYPSMKEDKSSKKEKPLKVVYTRFDKNGHLFVTLSDGRELDAGDFGYKKVKAACDVKFFCGDTLVKKETVTMDEKLTQPILDTFSIKGWYLDQELTKKWDFDSMKVQGPITLYGDYKANCSYVSLLDEVAGNKFELRKFVFGYKYALPVPYDYSSEHVFSSWLYNDKPIDLRGTWKIPSHATLRAKWVKKEKFDYRQFGYYPQTAVTDKKLIRRLNEVYESGLGIKKHSLETQGYGAKYVGNTYIEYDGMRYKRFEWFGNHPGGSASYRFRNGSRVRDISSTPTFYFKVEPIEWKVFNTRKGKTLAVTKKVLDVWWAMWNIRPYADNHSLNDYAYSNIRNWMNGNHSSDIPTRDRYNYSLFDTDLTLGKKEYDSLLSHYKSDKLFLLSKEECEDLKNGGNSLRAESSDHALAYQSTEASSDYQYMSWVTRESLVWSNDRWYWRVKSNGEFGDDYRVDYWGAVRPAIRIK